MSEKTKTGKISKVSPYGFQMDDKDEWMNYSKFDYNMDKKLEKEDAGRTAIVTYNCKDGKSYVKKVDFNVEDSPEQEVIDMCKDEATTDDGEAIEPKEESKDMGKVDNYKVTESDKYEIGMAKNNAAVILAGQYTKEGYENLVKELYEVGRKLRQEILGY